ncbi:arginine-tRNA (Arg) ligase [Parastagonospora nodorum]|nr:arginine-tRNA (Arg) ligase [Parastagonospora nodorum]KAH3967263.1 arginine-tRNA (Arg) ligase [Parastagonospora nodorum]KAH3993073.1 arginine-tRNA (Arg) ligase [Parastagonospora nodorum]KAH4010814.1 arginine-tRNA (Arg) ligase [Parastagonospora nodorum]KAH4062191.1 arginine-tRNA (Arg) ligase [Parastagonospora nodorum]
MEDLTNTLKTLGLSTVPQEPNTYPALNPFDIYRSHITELLAPISGVDKAVIYRSLSWTSKAEHGDLQLAVPALRLKKKPDEMKAFTQELADKFPESPLVKKPLVTNTSLGFFFNAEPLTQLVLPMVLKSGAEYGFNRNLGLRNPEDPAQGKKKMIVEFSSPNIAKPFHAGHLRSTIIGGFLANLYEGAGWDVVRMNYLGDWGKQYGVLAIGFDLFGNEEELVKNPIGHLYDIYVKVSTIQHEEAEQVKALKAEAAKLKEEGKDASEQEANITKIETEGIDEQARKYFKGMVDGEPKALGIWKRFRDLSIEKYKATYARLNIRYDDYSGESQVKDESMELAAKIMWEKKVCEDSEGAVIVDLTKHSKKLGKAVVKKKDGTSLYLTRDIGEAIQRVEKYHFDHMIYVVASQQDLHLAQLFKIEELMGRTDISSRCTHINFGMVLGMSTRKGTAKFLDDILRDVGEKMHDVMRSNQAKYEQVENPDQVADTLGISAVMVQDMKGKRINNYTFDMDRMTSFEGDTGPYLQYAHARLCSIYRKALAADPSLEKVDLASADLNLLTEPHAIDLVRQLASWPDTFLNTIKTQEPTTVLTYLFKMAHALSSSYDHLQVVGTKERGVMLARLALYVAARQVLSNGMRVLGLSPVERM